MKNSINHRVWVIKEICLILRKLNKIVSFAEKRVDMSTTYINPRTDYGFKYLFGDEETLRGFLNEALRGEPGFEPIASIEYDNKELEKLNKEKRGVVYDLLCTTDTGKRFIVEMQKGKQSYFIDRSIYYLAKSIVAQEEKGADWKFEYSPVYMVSILEFTIDALGDKVRTDAALLDLDTHEPITDKVRFLYIQLPHFNKRGWEECENDFELWIYLIKHMETMETIPFAKPGSTFSRLGEMASYANMSDEEKFAYDQDLQVYRDYKNTIDYAKEQGEKEGRNQMVRSMYANGLPVDVIAKISKLSVDEVKQILAS